MLLLVSILNPPLKPTSWALLETCYRLLNSILPSYNTATTSIHPQIIQQLHGTIYITSLNTITKQSSPTPAMDNNSTAAEVSSSVAHLYVFSATHLENVPFVLINSTANSRSQSHNHLLLPRPLHTNDDFLPQHIYLLHRSLFYL